jgi:hypothetical protein
MNGASRALIGAALGAVLTLFAHPASRPFLIQAFLPGREVSLAPVTAYGERLPAPTSLLEAALWMHAGAERMLSRDALSPTELQSLVKIADAAAQGDGENAFWRQMAAVYSVELGRSDEAVAYWRRASLAARWNDYQSQQLLEMRESLAREIGSRQAWQLGLAYGARSSAAVTVIQLASSRIIHRLTDGGEEEASTRAATVRNGDLIRKGSRSVAIGAIGADIVEAACQSPGLDQPGATKRLVLARLGLINGLYEHGLRSEAAMVEEAFRANDGWLALTQEYRDRQVAAELAEWAAIVALAPGAFLLTSFLGLLLHLYGRALRSPRQAFTAPAVLGIGVLVGIGVYALTMHPLAGLAAALCFGFVVFTPQNERKLAMSDLGPFYGFTTGLLALVLLVVLFALIASAGQPVRSVLPALGWPSELVRNTGLYLALALIVLGLLFLVAPFWAFAHRIPTQAVLSLGLRRLGATVAVAGLILTVLTGPVAVYADRSIGDTLQKLVENEPVYYLLQ